MAIVATLLFIASFLLFVATMRARRKRMTYLQASLAYERLGREKDKRDLERALDGWTDERTRLIDQLDRYKERFEQLGAELTDTSGKLTALSVTFRETLTNFDRLVEVSILSFRQAGIVPPDAVSIDELEGYGPLQKTMGVLLQYQAVRSTTDIMTANNLAPKRPLADQKPLSL